MGEREGHKDEKDDRCVASQKKKKGSFKLSAFEKRGKRGKLTFGSKPTKNVST